jgi:peptide/nickel transport system permease protein
VLGFVLRRLAWAIVLFFALTLYTYVLFFVIPGNDETIRRGFRVDQGTTLRETVGIEGGSIVREYGSFVSHVVHGDFGVSQRNRQPVLEVIGRAAPVTMSLVVGGALVWLLLALPIGLISALRPRSLLDRGGMIFVLIGVSARCSGPTTCSCPGSPSAPSSRRSRPA